jgi:hypothetical protein
VSLIGQDSRNIRIRTGGNPAVWLYLEAEVDAECLVEFSDERCRQLVKPPCYPSDSHRPDPLNQDNSQGVLAVEDMTEPVTPDVRGR